MPLTVADTSIHTTQNPEPTIKLNDNHYNLLDILDIAVENIYCEYTRSVGHCNTSHQATNFNRVHAPSQMKVEKLLHAPGPSEPRQILEHMHGG